MSFGFRSVPNDVQLNSLSRRVFDALAKRTSFPWAVMMAQGRRIDVDAANLTAESLRSLVPFVAKAVGRFTSPETEERVDTELHELADSA